MESAYSELSKNLPTDSSNFINNKDVVIVPRVLSRYETGYFMNALGVCGIIITWDDCDHLII